MTPVLLSEVDRHLLSLCVGGSTYVDFGDEVASIRYSNVDLHYRVVESGGELTILRTERDEDESAVFRSNEGHAIVVELVRLSSGRRIRGCVLERPPGFVVEQGEAWFATFRWGEGSWAQSLSDDWSLTAGLEWAWVFAAGDEAIARWLSGGVLYPEDVSKKCETPPLFAYQLTVATWEDWLAGRPSVEGAKS